LKYENSEAGGKGHVKHKSKRLKLTFDELLVKYQRENKVKGVNRSSNVK
jgi:hypothetical protein